MNVFEMCGVYVRRGGFLLRDISFSVGEEETVALLGQSGAGKSTLIAAAGNALMPDAGIIRYFGKELFEDEAAIRGELSVVYDRPNFNTELRAGRLARELRRFEPDFSEEYFMDGLGRLGLEEERRVKQFSAGQMKSFMLLLALARTPRLLVMDEPTSGLDEEAKGQFWQMIADYRSSHGLAVLFTTHSRSEAEGRGERLLELKLGEMEAMLPRQETGEMEATLPRQETGEIGNVKCP